MLNSFYLFLVPLVLIILYLFFKFLKLKIFKGTPAEDVEKDNMEDAKEVIFIFIDDLKLRFAIITNKFFHWLLHFFVILLKYLSILTDKLYAKSRDFFLYTATKEKEVVTTFWHTLKEYKKEKEEENENNK